MPILLNKTGKNNYLLNNNSYHAWFISEFTVIPALLSEVDILVSFYLLTCKAMLSFSDQNLPIGGMGMLFLNVIIHIA